MKRFSGNIKKVLFSLLIIFVNVISSTFATLAWYTSSTQVQGNLGNLEVKYDEYVLSYEVYRYYSLETNVEGIYTFDKTSSTDKNLGGYSILSSGYQILFKINLTDFAASRNNLYLCAHTNTSTYLGELDTNGNLVTQLSATNNPLSSIVCFYSFKTANIDSSNASYNLLNLSNSSNLSNKKANFISSDYKIVNNSNVGIGLFQNSDYLASKSIYVVLDYDGASIERIYGLNIGNSVINGEAGSEEHWLYYSPDFYFFINEEGVA